MHRIRCSEVWGGNINRDEDLVAAGVRASLYSSAHGGGRGGDIYYVSVCDSDLLTRVAICDVVGHGEKVSAISSWLYDTLLSKMNDPDGSSVLKDLNGIVCARGLEAMTTAAVVSYYKSNSEMMFSYAGHPPAWFWKAKTGRWELAALDYIHDGPADIPLGVFEHTHYRQQGIGLTTGDRFIVLTDGITETQDDSGAQFGAVGVSRVLDQLESVQDVSTIRRAIVDAARAHTGGELVHDDVTILVAEIS